VSDARRWVRLDPSDGSELGSVAIASRAEVATAVVHARAAQPRWHALPLEERLLRTRTFAEVLWREQEAFAADLSREMGKPLAQARAEYRAVAERIDFFLAAAAQEYRPRPARGGPADALWEVVSPEPLGVVGNISAWNYPVFVSLNVLLPALLAGNTVVYKPSEFALQTGANLVAAAREAGFDEGVLGLVRGDGSSGAALVAQPLDALAFTGSAATGGAIHRALAGRRVRLQLELGGKDPAYVRPDVDVIAAAAALAEGAFYNAGQSCCAVERIYVHAEIYDAFADAFVAAAGELRVGHPFSGADVGPLARRAQLPLLQAQVDEARGLGGEVALGGGALPGPGFYFPPTVVLGAHERMALMREESFGPVIGIARVADDAEALARMNDTDYGLTAAVFTRDEGVATAMMKALEAGTVYWNACDRVSPYTPWSGWKGSGVGATLGLEGMRAMVRPKAFHFRRPV
jgi:acyl-CoA reductase-like NAD-dependent aldehyde dehydrogenase